MRERIFFSIFLTAAFAAAVIALAAHFEMPIWAVAGIGIVFTAASAFVLATVISRKMLAETENMRKVLTEQQNELKKEHEAQDKMRREFTANVSHELKTPLTSISGLAEIIQNGLVKQEDISRFAGNIYDETQRLITLVGDIMKLSQLDEDAVPAQKEQIDLYESCSAVISQLKSTADKRGVRFTLEGEHVSIIGVEQIIDEIIYNLCDNAIKYNKENGWITVRVYSGESGNVLPVSDTGIGIPPEDTEHIFQRFYRVNKSHSKEIGGTGLGLSIVKHGAAYHNADIKVESTLGVGTRISVIFPQAQESAGS